MSPARRFVVSLGFVLGWVGLFVLGFASGTARAADPTDPPLIVGTKESPPYAYKDEEGIWSGSSIELWREIALALDVEYQFEERDLDGLLRGLERGDLDVAVAALTITSERERRFDFTHPFETSGLSVAVSVPDVSLWSGLWETLRSRQFLQLMLGLGGMQFMVGTLMWWFERKHPHPDFEANPRQGLFSGYWWAVVTMTTVGYGDKTPQTRRGRILALAWMIVSIILISTFTATVASMNTLNQLNADIRTPDDLVRLRVGTIRHSTSETWLRDAELNFRDYEDGPAAITALRNGEIDAVIYDRGLLEQLMVDMHADEIEDLELLSMTWQRQDYAFAVPSGSPLREEINAVLPALLRDR